MSEVTTPNWAHRMSKVARGDVADRLGAGVSSWRHVHGSSMRRSRMATFFRVRLSAACVGRDDRCGGGLFWLIRRCLHVLHDGRPGSKSLFEDVDLVGSLGLPIGVHPLCRRARRPSSSGDRVHVGTIPANAAILLSVLLLATPRRDRSLSSHIVT